MKTTERLTEQGIKVRSPLVAWLSQRPATVMIEEVRSVSTADRVVLLDLIDGAREQITLSSATQACELSATLKATMHPAEAALPRITSVDRLGDELSQLLQHKRWLPSAVWELVMLGASQLGASDLHLEVTSGGGRLLIRVDGLLHPLTTMDRTTREILVNRLKVMANLISYRCDRSQEGRVELQLDDHKISARVTTAPGLKGEQVAVRIHDAQKARIQLKELGFDLATLNRIERVAELERGLVVIAGPPSSGKSTTLFALLRRIIRRDGHRRRIVSIEDPIEVDLPGVSQVQVDQVRGNSFAALFKVALRQNAEVIALGEIRDLATAELAVQAGLSGHLVVTTVHAGSVAEAVARLQRLGLKEEDLAGSLKVVISQKLVPRTCSRCQGAGCPRCEHKGWSGRQAQGEALESAPAAHRPTGALASWATGGGA